MSGVGVGDGASGCHFFGQYFCEGYLSGGGCLGNVWVGCGYQAFSLLTLFPQALVVWVSRMWVHLFPVLSIGTVLACGLGIVQGYILTSLRL